MENQLNNKNIVYTKTVIEFVTVAGEYCKFVENASAIEKKELIGNTQKLLALLYLKASVLPVLASSTDDFIEKFVTEEQWIEVKLAIAEKLGDDEQFLEIKEPGNLVEGETVSVSLAECFADIYQDMKDFITVFSMGDERAMFTALYECITNFEQFWGPRALHALTVLHNLNFNYIRDK